MVFSKLFLDLPTNYADAVIAAMCFHWFANTDSINDIHRVLKPGGRLGVVWYQHDESTPWVDEFRSMLEIEYRKSNIACVWNTNDWLPRLVHYHGGFGPNLNKSNKCFMNNTLQSFQSVFNLYSTASVVAAAEEGKKVQMLRKIREMVQCVKPDVPDKNLYELNFIIKTQLFQKL